jgi:hypothetical protein
VLAPVAVKEDVGLRLLAHCLETKARRRALAMGVAAGLTSRWANWKVGDETRQKNGWGGRRGGAE